MAFSLSTLVVASFLATCSSALFLRQPGVEDIITEVGKKRKECTLLEREDSYPPDGGWESVAPSERPDWWVPEGSSHPPAGSKVAIAFRGDYRRFSQDGFKHCKGPACSDYWVSKDNIEQYISQPLQRAGAKLRFYFHTYSDADCPAYDRKLVRDIKPSKYKFHADYRSCDADHNDKAVAQACTYFEVMKLVVEDGWAEFAILLRFDIQYFAPITSWKMDWHQINYLARKAVLGLSTDDFIYIIPKQMFSVWQEGVTHARASRTEKVIDTLPDKTNPIIYEGRYPPLYITRNCSATYHDCPA